MPPFQFTPLREGRLCTAAIASARANFNSRPSARGDRRCTSSRTQYSNFNSRPSARGDGEGDDCAARQQISIHAPPRGATSCAIVAFSKYPFQFTPLREGRLFEQGDCAGLRQFQFTPLREGRRIVWIQCFLSANISIHAPPRGATPCTRMDKINYKFQFTPLREGRRHRE